eukprot:gene3994-20079_t
MFNRAPPRLCHDFARNARWEENADRPSRVNTLKKFTLSENEVIKSMMAATEVVFLNKDDVPGAKLLKKPSECSVTELKRWLECRGAKESGTKKVLIERVKDCLKIKMKIDPKIEGGKWYEAKANKIGAADAPMKPKDVQDNEGYDSYALRAHIHHSMKKELPLSTQIALSKSSGFVKSAYCTCVAKSLGRCAHVAALLLFLNDYITKNTCHVEVPKTSLLCNWNKGKRRNKNPIELHKDIYNSPKEKVETYYQDLRPVKYRKTDDTLKATFVKDSQTISAAKQELSIPDGIIIGDGKEVGIVEIKCLKIFRSRNVEDLLSDISKGTIPKKLIQRQCFLIHDDGSLKLKQEHKYYYKVQLQLL